MSILARLIDKLHRPKPTIIDTPWGPVSESARRQAEINCMADPVLRERITTMLMGRFGTWEAARAEARRRYPLGGF